jgi:hypothetical protein
MAVVLFAMSGLAPQPLLSAESDTAQAADASSRRVIELPASELNEIKEELQYLRARDAERQAWEESVDGQFSKARVIPPGSSNSDQFDGKQPICDCCDEDTGSCRLDSRQSTLPDAPSLDPRVFTLGRYFKIQLYGALKLDAVFNTARPVVQGTPFYLLPASPIGLDTKSIDVQGRQTLLGAALTGADFGDFHTGGLVLGTLYSSNIFADQYGFLPLQAYGEIKNDDWRFSAGIQFDVFAPLGPTMLAFSGLAASGNVGNTFRGSVRLERYLHPSEDVQWTIQGALSDPVTTVIDPAFTVIENNGWPNVEGRIAVGIGVPESVGGVALRPFEVGLSGVVGQIRQTNRVGMRVVTDVWGIATDLRWNLTRTFGVSGELYTGNSVGNYNGAILQLLNPNTAQGIRSSGGWGEVFLYWTPYLHSHAGYAVDRPVDSDIVNTLTEFGRTFNRTIYSNLLWDVTQSLRIGIEATWRNTDYKAPEFLDNQGFGFQTQFQWTF